MQSSRLFCIFLVLAAGFSKICIAQEITADNGPQVYQVEIILFRYTDPARTSSEALNTNATAISQTQIGDSATGAQAVTQDSLNATSGGRARWIPVDPASQRLGEVSQRLSASGGYKVLAYRSWLQLIDSQSNAEVLQLTDLDIESNAVSGQLQLYRQQSIYFAPDIRLGDVESAATPTIKGSRRIPLGKAVYFDHSQFGLIAMVTESDIEWQAE